MNVDNAKSQMRKGMLEYCVMLLLRKEPSYASDIITRLKEADLIVVEGTLYPLLTRLKKDGLLSYEWRESTSHIPVIILTAQATDDTHAACYEAGADGYLTKPFDIRVLTTRIDNLLLQYRQRSRQFLHAPDTDCDVLPYQNRDKTFLENMVKTVESHFTDSDFNLDYLAAEVKLSKSTMNRKLKAMTGLTPMDFVKNIRLRSACRLLRQADMTVSEVAYAVGFNDPKYFAKCFKEEYGQTPRQFQDRPDMGNRA